MKNVFGLVSLSTILLSGCSLMGGAPANVAPSEIPPQLVYDKDADGKIHPESLAWDRPDAFGSVPKNLQAKGNENCQAANFRVAVGYHPKALNAKGSPIPGGAYLCMN